MSRRRQLTLAAAAALFMSTGGFTAAASAASPPAFDISIATPADDGPHRGALTEWWYFNLVNPATKETFIYAQQSRPVPQVTTFWYNSSGGKAHWTWPTTPVAATGQPAACSNAGCFSYSAQRGAYHLVFSYNGVSGDIWFDAAKPGVTAGPSVYDGQEMYWTNPVATSATTGWIHPVGSLKRISVDGWRGYHDHNWGDFNLGDQTYTGWEWGNSHEPDGAAKVMGGVVDSLRRYHGVIVQVDADGTRYCRASGPVGGPAMEPSDYAAVSGFAYPTKVRTSCTSMGSIPAQTWRATEPHLADFGLFKFTESLGYTTPGSVALVEHFRTPANYGS